MIIINLDKYVNHVVNTVECRWWGRETDGHRYRPRLATSRRPSLRSIWILYFVFIFFHGSRGIRQPLWVTTFDFFLGRSARADFWSVVKSIILKTKSLLRVFVLLNNFTVIFHLKPGLRVKLSTPLVHRSTFEFDSYFHVVQLKTIYHMSA